MARKILLVQFTHPGGEHVLTRQELKDCIKQWNYGPHRRKFLKAEGQYVKSEGTLSTVQELLFWGEWEPTSKASPVSSTVGIGVMPRYVHVPFLQGSSSGLILPPITNSKGIGRQNTDPFVFGKSFLYSCCKQRKRIKNSTLSRFTQLGGLEKGSIILFGSTISPKQGGSYFVLDTVFVVGDYRVFENYTATTDLGGYVPREYYDIMGFKDWPQNNKYVCYKGATVNNSVDGMFSFVPCRPCTSGMVGFPRVKLTSKDFVFLSDNLNASPKFVDPKSNALFSPKDCWDRICTIVKRQGFELGVNFSYLLI